MCGFSIFVCDDLLTGISAPFRIPERNNFAYSSMLAELVPTRKISASQSMAQRYLQKNAISIKSRKNICPKEMNQKATFHKTQTECFKTLFSYAILFFMVEHIRHLSFIFIFIFSPPPSSEGLARESPLSEFVLNTLTRITSFL